MSRYRLSLFLFLTTLLLLGAACAIPHAGYHRIGKVELAAKPKDAPIEVCEDLVTYPYQVVASVDSRPTPKVTAESKALLLEDLQANARLVGADAVHRIRVLKVHGRSKVPDEKNPIPGSWKQGPYTQYMFRGEAIVKKQVQEQAAPSSEKSKKSK
ncbi:TPA: hypothetical protein DDW35_03940 [Candidatus Sumerlaeota bacterium]|jgi:hypothetical protein|nr:hypothetical protein [Candidatus Sumerlaeota bacterium]